MDDDDMRRGKPTVHRQFDEATAVLVGDSLQSLAFEVLGSEQTHKDPFVRAELVLALARAAGPSGMAGGQMMDLEAADRKSVVEGKGVSVRVVLGGGRILQKQKNVKKMVQA